MLVGMTLLAGCATWDKNTALTYALEKQTPKAAWQAARKYNPSRPGECVKEAFEITEMLLAANVPAAEWQFKRLDVIDTHAEQSHAVVTGETSGEYWLAEQHGFYKASSIGSLLVKLANNTGHKYKWNNENLWHSCWPNVFGFEDLRTGQAHPQQIEPEHPQSQDCEQGEE